MKSVISMELKFNIPPSSTCRLLKTIRNILRGGGRATLFLVVNIVEPDSVTQQYC